jgi:hypothetical protein
MQAETRFNAKVKARLELFTPSWVIKTQMVSLRGIPDHFALINSKLVVLEGKMKDKDTNKEAGREVLQRYHLRKAKAAGAYANWITPNTFDKVFQEIQQFCYGK